MINVADSGFESVKLTVEGKVIEKELDLYEFYEGANAIYDSTEGTDHEKSLGVRDYVQEVMGVEKISYMAALQLYLAVGHRLEEINEKKDDAPSSVEKPGLPASTPASKSKRSRRGKSTNTT